MSFGFKKFEDKSNFELKNNFKNFENIPKKPSVYPRGSDGYVLERVKLNFIIKILCGLDGEGDMNYIHLHNRY